MLTLRTGTTTRHEIEIKRSRFIATLTRADDAAAAREFIDGVKSEFPDARHNCSAFLISEHGRNPIQHSSDDGEPSGTAGQPMLDALRNSGTWNVAAVVTRYFGGVLLGAGGLVRAYSNSVTEALAVADHVDLRELQLATARLRPDTAGRVEAELRAAGLHVHDVEWGADVALTIAIDEGELASADTLLASLTKGAATWNVSGTTSIEVDAPRGQV